MVSIERGRLCISDTLIFLKIYDVHIPPNEPVEMEAWLERGYTLSQE